MTFTLPQSVFDTIARTGSPKAGLVMLRKIRGLRPIAPLWELVFAGVPRREHLNQFCLVFDQDVTAAKAQFQATIAQTQASTARKPKAAKKSKEVNPVTDSQIDLLQQMAELEARLEALRASVDAPAKPAASKAPKAKAAKLEATNTFTSKVVAKFDLPTKAGSTFQWKTGSTFQVVRKLRNGSIEVAKLAA